MAEEEKKEVEKPKEEAKPKKSEKKAYNPNWDSLESIVVTAGKWSWVIGLVNGLIYLFWSIYIYIVGSAVATWGVVIGSVFVTATWYLIGAILTIILSVFFVRPRFSKKCSSKDWDSLMDDVLVLGNLRIPWMFIWGILLEIFGQWWAGAPIIFVAVVLVFFGPKPYEWTK
jgi:hypothetical protein